MSKKLSYFACLCGIVFTVLHAKFFELIELGFNLNWNFQRESPWIKSTHLVYPSISIEHYWNTIFEISVKAFINRKWVLRNILRSLKNTWWVGYPKYKRRPENQTTKSHKNLNFSSANETQKNSANQWPSKSDDNWSVYNN